MFRRNTLVLLAIALLFGLAIWSVARPDIRLGSFQREGIKLGLDLRGGAHLVYQADLTGIPAEEREARMSEAVFKIERRVNAFGIAEPIIQKQEPNRISVELPGVKGVAQAIDLIGKTARLEFKKRTFDAQGSPVDTPLGLTGEDFKRAYVGNDPNQQVPRPVVNFEFKERGAEIFKQVTTEIAGTGNQVAVFLDEELVVSATADQPIEGGSGFIFGGFTAENDWEYARTMVIQLNAGALPVPLKLIEREDVDAFLGKDSLRKSILAGEIGLGVVLLFMVIYYRLPGALASAALLVYAFLVFAAFKLLPVTLTLAGIAAFILSIGMAVDANILIFERMKEELMGGRTLRAAISSGFARAWPSIRDSNVSTFITCGILYMFGNWSGEPSIMGFALTLAIGVAASMFTAIVVTRAFMAPAAELLGRRLGLFTPPATPRGRL